jgi:hypothetical protein
MTTPQIKPKDIITTGTSSFSVYFEVIANGDSIRSIEGGGAIDDFDYLLRFDPTGTSTSFIFDFTNLNRTISSTSTLNVVIKITDFEGHVFEWAFSNNGAVNSGYPYISNLRISQRKDGTRLVDVEYDYFSPYEIDPATVSITLSDNNGETWTLPTNSLVGDFGYGVAVGSNRKITWNPAIDLKNPVPISVSAQISLSNADGNFAYGNKKTGSVIVYPEEIISPIVFVAASPKTPYANPNGNLFKILSIPFVGIESSSESSQSIMSSSSLSSSSSSSSGSSSSSSSLLSHFDYFFADEDYAWDTIANWWKDSSFTIPLGRLPLNGDTVYIASQMHSGPSVPVTLNRIYVASSITGGGEFSVNFSNAYGNAEFYNEGINVGVINGDATFNDESWSYGGEIIGNVVFNDNSWSYTQIYGDVTYYDFSYNTYWIHGNATFYDYSYNDGAVFVDATFYGSNSWNHGSVFGDAAFQGTVRNDGTISGTITVF